MKNYCKTTINAYKESFANLNLLGIVFIMDALFAIAATMLSTIAGFLLKTPLKNLGSLDLMSIGTKSIEELQSITSILRNSFISVGSILLLSFLFIMLFFALFEGIAWCKILNKKVTLQYLRKFALLNIVLAAILMAIALVILIASKEQARNTALIVIMIVFNYISLLVFYYFTKENKFSQIKKALKISATKIHSFILPLLIIFVTYCIITFLSLLCKNLPQLAATIISSIMFLLLFSWVKVYIAGVISAFEQKPKNI